MAELARELRSRILCIRTLAHEAELDEDSRADGEDLWEDEASLQRGEGDLRWDDEDVWEDDADLWGDGRGLVPCNRRANGLGKRKHVNDGLSDRLLSEIQRLRTSNPLRIVSYEGQGLKSAVDRLRALQESDLDPDQDLNVSAAMQHRKEMDTILNDHRYSHVRELVYNLTMPDLEYARASVMALVMEPDENRPAIAAPGGLARPRKPRLPYTVTCALKKTNWFEMSLRWSDPDFRRMYRMSKSTFWEIVNLIRHHEVFEKQGRGRPQRPVHYQLGVFLLRYGCHGTTARVPMLLTSVGEGTVLLYCRRVICAIRTFGLTVVGWPTTERKEVIMADFQQKCGLNGIVGALDGVLIELSHKPAIDGDVYIGRKGDPSITVQATCDHEGRFTSFESGLPGSRPDTYVWSNSELCRKRNQVFKPGEFLLADGGYPVSPFVVTPFDVRERRVDGDRKLRFNEKISRARVVIERTFGQLKGRFPALKLLGPVENMKELHRAVEAMMVLHNACYDLHDRPDGFVDGFVQSRTDNNQEAYDYVEQGPDLEEMDVNGGEEVFTGNLRQAGLFF
ncbi:hypothetical protein FRC08_000012 [Ceratobasidium sp. 394]|nr:hypothetical protein FRC08_000012 [Ceratobasidium sp. 394]